MDEFDELEGTGANCDYRCVECEGPCDVEGFTSCDCPCHEPE